MSRLSLAPHRRPSPLAAMLALALLSACDGGDASPVPPVARPTAVEERSDAARDVVVAVANGQAITAAELDATLRLSLFNLEQAQYEMRSQRLRQLLIERVLGPAAAKEGLSIDAYVDRQVRAPAADSERREGVAVAPSGADLAARREAYIRAAFERAGVKVLLPEPEPPVVAIGIGGAAVRGDPNAPVTIVELADFQCPHSARAQPILRRLLSDYDHVVRLVMRDLPLGYHREARAAAEAARCAGAQGKYWDYHDVLFQNQDDLARPALERYAARVGLDPGDFTQCLDTGRFGPEVSADADEATRLGVTSTPTFFINGRYLKGPQPYAMFAQIIDAELTRLGIARTTAPPRAGEMAAVAATPQVTPGSQAEPSPAADSVVTLRRSDLAHALADRPQLEKHLSPAPLDVEGRRLLKLTEVPPGSLYEKMGLRPDDVVMQVNGEWVHDQHNPLWDALGGGGRVTVRVMRRGLPKTFEYAIE